MTHPRIQAEIERIEYAIAANTPCQCGHPIDHHDAGECWTTADGHEAFEETTCRCAGYEPAQVAG